MDMHHACSLEIEIGEACPFCECSPPATPSPKPQILGRVWVKAARNLVASDVSGLTGEESSDPLVKVRIGSGSAAATSNFIQTLNPSGTVM